MIVSVVTIDGSTVVLPSTVVESLKVKMRGSLLTPDEREYEEARRIWNGLIDRRPALIARCTGTADIIQAVQFAREHSLLISVKGGGHNVAGKAVCDGGLMIDLSLMNGVRVDPTSRTARVEPGCALGDVDHETQQFGLVLPSGIVTTTGVAGLTLGGGFGWLSRKWGLTCDHLKSADLITAKGELVHVNEQENEDLLWGLRGGGGNFGIVTSFEFKLRPLGPEVTAGLVFHPLEEAEKVLKFFRQFLIENPERVTGIIIWRIAPPLAFIRKEFHGKPVVAMGACYAGPAQEGRQVLAPLKEYGFPVGDILIPKPFVIHQATLDKTQSKGNLYYWKSEYFVALTNEIISALSRQAGNISSPHSVIALFQVGGAINQVAEDETAYSYRDAGFVLNINAQWTDKGESTRHIGWARECWHSILPYSMGGGYTNFASQDEDEDRVQSAYGAEKYERLVALKTYHDPDNFFRLNQNIKPQ